MQNIVSFNCGVKYYAEHWDEMSPDPPAICVFEGCNGRMHRNGFYKRIVIDEETWRSVGVFRFWCPRCGGTVSFLPDFCVPYKRFSVDVIGTTLWAVLVQNLAGRAAASEDSGYNKACFSYYCAADWVKQFCRNSHNLWHIGLARLGIAVVPVPDSEASLLKHLAGFPTGSSTQAPCDLRAAQCALSSLFPPFGVFRALLLPGCCT